MSSYSVILGRAIGLSAEGLELLEVTAPMHDIGKVGIPDEILMKPGKLTGEEYAVMKRHPEIGASILQGQNSLMIASREIALGHHEKWNGSGYPRGLRGEETPLFARICALADVFDALTTRRPYKEPWPLDRTLALVREEAGEHFDPILVEALFQNLDEIVDVASMYADHEDSSHLFGDEAGLSNFDVPRSADLTRHVSATEAPGVEVVLRQHRFLMDIAGRLETASISTDTRELVECLSALQRDLPRYFVDEENLMRQHGYSGTDEHERSHREFAGIAAQLLGDLDAAPLATNFDASRSVGKQVRAHVEEHGSAFLAFLRDR